MADFIHKAIEHELSKAKERVAALEHALKSYIAIDGKPRHKRSAKKRAGTTTVRKRHISPEGRRRIIAAQKARWAKLKKAAK